jgi:flagellar hook-associated protein 1 FlgK
MLGLFSTLNLASRSLQTQMTGVEIAGQNLANVNTTGYSRQRVEIQTSPDVSTGIGLEGTGASAVGIQQIVSDVLNRQIQNQSSVGGYWSTQQSALQNLQNSLGEFLSGTGGTDSTGAATGGTSSSGLSSQLSALFNAFQAVATAPASLPARQSLIGAAQQLAATFNQLNGQFATLHDSLNASLNNDVTSANKLLTDIAGLNAQIAYAQFSGGNANDLLDQREQDLENLGQLTSFTSSTGSSGMLNVTVGGQLLVSGNQVLDRLQTYDAGGGRLLVQTAGGNHLTLTGGSLQGTIDARDETLAGLQTSVNTLAATLITQVNAVHGGGYSLTGSTGANFFNGTDAATITVNASLADDPSLIQASASATAAGDNSVALQLAQLASTAQPALNQQTPGDAYAATVAQLGQALQNANDQVTSQTAVANLLSSQRSSISGVNIDEEMTNLLGFQKAYSASAQLVKTVDEMFADVLAMKT